MPGPGERDLVVRELHVEPFSKGFLQGVEDSAGVLNDGKFFAVCDQLLADVNEERLAQGGEEVNDNFKRIFTYELFRVCTRFDVKPLRKDGSSVFYSHLVGTLKGMIKDQGITGIASLLAMVNHDTVEDFTPSHLVGRERKNTESELMKDLIDFSAYIEKLENFDVNQAEELSARVRKMVEGVTKWRQMQRFTTEEDRDATREATFDRFLKVIIDNIRAACLKISDRVHNMSTLSGHGNSPKGLAKQVEITQETVDVYLPLARILGLIESVRHLVRYCVMFQNPELLRDFGELFKERQEKRLAPYMMGIVESFSELGEGAAVEFRPRGLDYYTAGVVGGFEGLNIDDLPIPKLDPMFEIVVKVSADTEEGLIDARKQAIMLIGEKFASDPGTKLRTTIPEKGDVLANKGALITVFNPKFGGQLSFRVNDKYAEARRKRGVLADYALDAPEFLRAEMRAAVNKSSSKAELLAPRITVITRDGEHLSMPRGATVLDFASAIHEKVLLGSTGAWVVDDLTSTDAERKVSLFDELEPGKLYIVDTAEDKNDRTRVKPSWLLFAKATARTEIRKHLRRRGEPDVMRTGREYVRHLSRLFGITAEEFKRMVLTQFNGKGRDLLIKEIGNGKVDPVEAFADICEKRSIDGRYAEGSEDEGHLWELEFQLPDEIGELNRFAEKFKSESGVNIFHIAAHTKVAESGYDVLSIKFDIKKSGISMYEFFKILVKLSYRYKMRMISNPYKGKKGEAERSFTDL